MREELLKLIEEGNILLEESKKVDSDKPDYIRSYIARLQASSMKVELFNEWSTKVVRFLNKFYKDDPLAKELIKLHSNLFESQNRQWFDKVMGYLKVLESEN